MRTVAELNAEFDPAYLENEANPRWVVKPTVAYLWALAGVRDRDAGLLTGAGLALAAAVCTKNEAVLWLIGVPLGAAAYAGALGHGPRDGR